MTAQTSQPERTCSGPASHFPAPGPSLWGVLAWGHPGGTQERPVQRGVGAAEGPGRGLWEHRTPVALGTVLGGGAKNTTWDLPQLGRGPCNRREVRASGLGQRPAEGAAGQGSREGPCACVTSSVRWPQGGRDRERNTEFQPSCSQGETSGCVTAWLLALSAPLLG